jgi:OOP family OmpA-OmpF porin
MKKLLLIPALLGTMAVASDYNYEVTPLIGYNIAEGNLNLDNEIITGLEVQLNDIDCILKPELSLLHSGGVKSEDILPTNKTNVTRVALNGVYEYTQAGSVIPFAKAGIGYEHMNRHFAENTDGAFVDAGAGVKIPFADNLALKLETIYMLKYNTERANGNNWGDSNLAVLAGLNYSFGKKAQPEPTPEPTPEPVDGDDDNDGVLNSVDKCPTTPTGKEVDANGCCVVVDGDDDNDGVLNSVDQCPNSPKGALVNEAGCPVLVNLHVNFEFNSYKVDAMSHSNIQNFADFLVMYPEYSAKIIGHTDSTGAEAYNKVLSQNRANAVKNLLVEKGANADKVSSSGMGETSPVADNSTKEGRAQNRRIEAELIKN